MSSAVGGFVSGFVTKHSKYGAHLLLYKRRSGLRVSALDSGSKGPGWSPGRVIVLCSWVRQFTLTVPLSTQEYKWIPANCQGNLTKSWEGYLRWRLASRPGGVAILLVASCYGNQDKLRLCGPLGSCADFTLFRWYFTHLLDIFRYLH